MTGTLIEIFFSTISRTTSNTRFGIESYNLWSDWQSITLAATGLEILHKLDSNRRFFSLCDLEIWCMTTKSNKTPLPYHVISNPSVNSKWSYSPGLRFFVQCDFEISQMTLKNNRAPLLCYFKFCALFHSHWCIQIWVTVRKRPLWVKSTIFLAVWTWSLTDDLGKTIWHLC